ncbi:MAG TPA: AAA family ATPase [Candidatus Lokiarchaeia archaeon]|nr:AAA family ATPase [Candidatus Lokiarchaeia archaeon]
MLVTIAGFHGTGKTTVAKCIADKFELDHYSTGMLFREMAEEKSMSLVEFSQHATKHKDIDVKLDKKMKALGMKGNCVLDGQLCWYFLRNEADWKILLTCDEETRIQRIFNREREKKGESITLDDIRNETLERERIEIARYLQIYGIDISNMEFVKKNHDIVVDTTDIGIEEVVEKIVTIMTPSM